MSVPATTQLDGPTRTWRVLAAIVFAAAGLVVIAAITANGWFTAALATLALAATVAAGLRWPSIWLWLALGLLFFGDRPEVPALAVAGRYAPTIAVLGFSATVAVRCWLIGRPLRGRWLLGLTLLYAVITLATWLYNDLPAIDLVLALVVYLRYPLFFVALVNADIPPRLFRQLMSLFVGLTLLQLPITIWQAQQGLSGDNVVGSFGSNTGLVAAVLVTQAILFAVWLTGGAERWLALAAMALLLLVPYLADIQVGFVLLPALLVVMVLLHTRRARVVSTLVVTGGLVLVLATGAFALVTLQPESLIARTIGDIPATIRVDPTTASYASLGRLAILPLAIPLLLDDPLRFLVGFGPETAQGGLLTGEGGRVCQELSRLGVLCREPQAFRSLMESGFVGTFLLLLPAALVWLAVESASRGQPGVAPAAVAAFSSVAALYLLFGFWYVSVWRLDAFALPFWLLGGCLVNLLRSRRGA